jgi:hypothetical protein
MKEGKEILKDGLQPSRKDDFVSYCSHGFDLLEKAAVSGTDIKSIREANTAMRRMLGFFVDQEEFEKCSVIKGLLQKHFPGNTEPIFDYRKI